jgi:hypothetical protein
MKPRAFCPRYELKPNITFANSERLAATKYNIKIPSGLAGQKLSAPEFVTYEKLKSLVKSKDTPKTLGLTYGLVTAEFDISFPAKTTQWKAVDGGKYRQFQGGTVNLDLKFGVYLWDYLKPKKQDEIGDKIFAIVMEHELLHVLDAVDVVSRWLPQKAYSDIQIKRLLSKGRPLPEKDYKHWIEKGNLTDWIENGYVNPEYNRRTAKRDSPAQYKAYSAKINALTAERINQP